MSPKVRPISLVERQDRWAVPTNPRWTAYRVPISKGSEHLERSSAVAAKQNAESSVQDDTSISGVRDLRGDQLDALPQGLGSHLRGIVITPKPGPADGDATREIERFQVEFAHDTQFFAGLSQDLARGGILIVTYRELPVGTAVHLDFELPNGIPVHAYGEVRWIREDSPTARRGLAIAFTDVSADALQGISEFCRVRPPLFLDLDT